MRSLKLKWFTLPAFLLALGIGFGVRGASAQGLAPGAQMPGLDLTLQNVAGGTVRLDGLRGERGTVVVFWSNECPWVSKYEDRIADLARAYMGKGVNFVLVNSNDAVAFPKESAAEGQRRARAGNYPMAYVVDPGSKLAVAFGAERTPHVYAFDANNRLVYTGTVDDSPADPGNVQKQYLRDALDAVVGGGRVPQAQSKAFGCTIKFADL